MASIRKHGKKWEVQYRVKGYPKPFFERFDTEEDAVFRREEIKYKTKKGTLTAPKSAIDPLTAPAAAGKVMLLEELFQRYIKLHGEAEMTANVIRDTEHRIKDYINPLIGQTPITDITPLLLTDFYAKLRKYPAKVQPGKEPRTVSAATIVKCHGDIRAALNKAIEWQLLPPGSNAALVVKPPRPKEKEVESWDYTELFEALDQCKDPLLHIVILMCVACTMRIGELLGLHWKDVDLGQDKGEIYIRYQIQRVKEADLKRCTKTVVHFRFPKIKQNADSVLILTDPKQNSKRHVAFEANVAEELQARRKRQEHEKALMGDAYQDFDLVIAQPNGRPYSEKEILKRLGTFCEENGLPDVVVHSLRHTSVDLKLELSGGNIKAVQADAGHRTEKMVTERYSAMRERRRNALATAMDTMLTERKLPTQ